MKEGKWRGGREGGKEGRQQAGNRQGWEEREGGRPITFHASPLCSKYLDQKVNAHGTVNREKANAKTLLLNPNP